MHSTPHISEPDNFAIREMETRDIARCIWVRTQTREQRWTLEALKQVGITEETVTQKLHTTHKGWVCESGGQIVGFSMVDQSTGEFWVVAVLPDHEGQGVGRQLIELVQQFLHANGWAEIWLWTSPDTSTRAYQLYSELGWRDCGVTYKQRIMRHAVV